MYKHFCSVHHFNYSDASCPFCEHDKISAYARKYTAKQEASNKCLVKEINRRLPDDSTNASEITEDMLEQLRRKFNG